MGEYADSIPLSETGADLVEQAIGPVNDHLVGEGEALSGGEDLTGVAHGDAVAEHLGDPHQCRREVDGPEDQHPRRLGEALDEHPDAVLAGLAMFAVVAYTAAPRCQLAQGIALDDPVEAGLTQGAHRVVRADEQLGTGAGALDHGGQGEGGLAAEQGRDDVEDRGRVFRCGVSGHPATSPAAR